MPAAATDIRQRCRRHCSQAAPGMGIFFLFGPRGYADRMHARSAARSGKDAYRGRTPALYSARCAGTGVTLPGKLQDLGEVLKAVVAISPAQVLRRDPDSLVGKQQVKRVIHLARAGEHRRGTRREEFHPDEPQMQMQLDGARSVAELAAAFDQFQAV